MIEVVKVTIGEQTRCAGVGEIGSDGRISHVWADQYI